MDANAPYAEVLSMAPPTAGWLASPVFRLVAALTIGLLLAACGSGGDGGGGGY